MTPLKAAEKLFFAILGPLRNSNHLIAVPPPGHPPYQPSYAKRLFKIGFGAYMLIMVVLFKLLIATMSDTYHQIQAQSYTEWKFGLCKLIRQARQTTAPSPMNLITTWSIILTELCKPRERIKLRPGRTPNVISKCFTTIKGSEVARKVSVMVSSMAEFGNNLGFQNTSNPLTLPIENAADWKIIANKYRILVGRVKGPLHNSEVTISESEIVTEEWTPIYLE